MHSFEDVRAHLVARHSLRANDPYLLSFDLPVGDGRRQSLFLAELESDDGRKYLRVSSPVAPLGRFDAAKCLRFNWEQRVGYFALSDLDGEPYLHLCENRPYNQLSQKELDHVIAEVGALADSLEHLMGRGKDVS
jgi:hypothetical protein